MWLLHCSSKVLVDAASEGWPEYAILSHVWSRDKREPEVSFQDMQDPRKASEMPGFVKIRQTCKRAINDEYQYVWIDTCCINKQNSSELSEAINSMFRWYREAAVCYAFLSDIRFETRSEIPYNDLKMSLAGIRVKLAKLWHDSEWFDRGWTLQELIAPRKVIFVDMHWKEFGTRETLTPMIVSKTGIPEEVLNNSRDLFSLSVAQRMSWASDRKTTRSEDKAYSLLGIFDINMPMLYGEGEKAFIRLQEEIIKTSDDHSLFSWRFTGRHDSIARPTGDGDSGPGVPQRSVRMLHGMLAPTPEAFKECRQVRRMTSRKGRSPYAMSNRGLSISFEAALWSIDTYIVPLYCDDKSVAKSHGTHEGEACLALLLTRLYEDDQYARTNTEDGGSLIRLDKHWWSRYNKEARYSTAIVNINVPQRVDRIILDNDKLGPAWCLKKRHVSGLRLDQPKLFGMLLHDALLWNDADQMIEMEPLWKFGKAINLKILADDSKSPLKQIKVGFDGDCNPICFVATKEGADLVVESISRRDEEERMGYRSINSRTVLDPSGWTNIWSKVSGDEAYELGARQGFRNGLWALRGDRLNGIDVMLVEQCSGRRRVRNLGRLRMQKVEIEQGERKGCIVWQLSLHVEINSRSRLDRLFG